MMYNKKRIAFAFYFDSRFSYTAEGRSIGFGYCSDDLLKKYCELFKNRLENDLYFKENISDKYTINYTEFIDCGYISETDGHVKQARLLCSVYVYKRKAKLLYSYINENYNVVRYF